MCHSFLQAGVFQVGEIAEMIQRFYNVWGLLMFAAPVPRDYMERYRRYLAGEPSGSYRSRSARSHSVAPSQSVHGGGERSSRRPPITPQSQSHVVPDTASEEMGETGAKRPRTTDQPPPNA